MAIARQKVIRIVKRVGRDNPEFAQGLMKWVPLLCSSINKVSWVTGQSDEDVLQDMLVGVSEINLMYSIPLYRHKMRTYEKVRECGSLVLLRTPRINKLPPYQLWVRQDSIEAVKKGKLESTLYREIFQQACDMINHHLTPKNGYLKRDAGTREVVVRSGDAGTVVCRKEVKRITRTGIFVDFAKLAEFRDWASNAEENAIFGQYIEHIKAKVSSTAAVVLDLLVEDPGASTPAVASCLGLKVSTASLARCEIIQNLPFASDMVTKVVSKGRSPVYMSVS